MSNLVRLTWEESEDFLSYLVRAGYKVVISCEKPFENIHYIMVILDQMGDELAKTEVEYDIDISTLAMRCLDDYITTNDGKDMHSLWSQ